MTTLTETKRSLPALRVQPQERQLTQVIALRPTTRQELQLLPKKSLAAFRTKPSAKPEPLRKLPSKKTYTVEQTAGWVSRISGHNLVGGDRIEIELPFGTPRFVSAATLKILLKGNTKDVLLKEMGFTWTICPNDLKVDLTDTKTRFRLGRIAVYS